MASRKKPVVVDLPKDAPAAPPPEGWTAPWRPDTARLLPPAAVSAAALQARSWRHEVFPEYKAKRAPPPEPLVDAQPMIQELLDALGLPGLLLGWTLVTLLVVFPAAFVSGVQFPLLIALLGSGGHGLGRQVGLAYAWNTVGSIAGSLAGGFGLMPLLTAPPSLWRSTRS